VWVPVVEVLRVPDPPDAVLVPLLSSQEEIPVPKAPSAQLKIVGTDWPTE
jgi:hypothetical protein